MPTLHKKVIAWIKIFFFFKYFYFMLIIHVMHVYFIVLISLFHADFFKRFFFIKKGLSVTMTPSLNGNFIVVVYETIWLWTYSNLILEMTKSHNRYLVIASHSEINYTNISTLMWYLCWKINNPLSPFNRRKGMSHDRYGADIIPQDSDPSLIASLIPSVFELLLSKDRKWTAIVIPVQSFRN